MDCQTDPIAAMSTLYDKLVINSIQWIFIICYSNLIRDHIFEFSLIPTAKPLEICWAECQTDVFIPVNAHAQCTKTCSTCEQRFVA